MARLTLEQRISRLEKLLKAKSRFVKNESFESDLDVISALEKANSMAEDFSDTVGATLTALTPDDIKDTDIVDSPVNGWSHDVVMDDTDARYTFMYDVEDYPGVSVYVRPTDNTFCVWQSLVRGSNCEGAVDPKTGMCEYTDDLYECSYPLAMWENFSMDMIHGEEFESVKRRRGGFRR